VRDGGRPSLDLPGAAIKTVSVATGDRDDSIELDTGTIRGRSPRARRRLGE
jgi:hypothetical protein